jgi:hypothetical protein
MIQIKLRSLPLAVLTRRVFPYVRSQSDLKMRTMNFLDTGPLGDFFIVRV